jgi:hypothetical protein
MTSYQPDVQTVITGRLQFNDTLFLMNSILDWLVVVLPTLLSLWGVFVTLEPLDKRHKIKWRVALFVSGLVVSSLTYWQQEVARVRAAGESREYHEQQIRQERTSAENFNALVVRFNAFVAERRQKPATIPRPPTAEEIASAVSQRLKDMQNTQPTTPTPTKNPPAPLTSAVVQPPLLTLQPCRGDRLSECSDEQLLNWGKPLVKNIEAIEDDYMADLKELDDIKAGKWNWLREIAGVGDKDSKWLNGYAQAQEKAADHFRDCCAEKAIVYHKELSQRLGGGEKNRNVYEWAQDLMKPEDSKESKKARQDAGKIVDLLGDLHQLPIDLKIAHLNAAIEIQSSRHQ